MVGLLPEIIDMVIDHLHDDQKSLFACSLVSRRWLPSCRFHLFRTITINDVKDEDDFKDVLSFFETHHGIPPIVRQLYVMGVFVSTPSLTLRSIGSLAIGFPNLHTLKLHNMKWTKSSSFVERHSVPAVRNLHLSNINISGGTRPLFDMMSVFPGLEALSMDYVHVPRDEIDHLRYLPEMDLPDRHLRKVSIHTSHVMLQFLGYIQITSSSRSLESLSISIPSSGVTRVGEFLRDVGPNLRDLHLRFTFPTPCFHVSEDFWNQIGISSCDALESIRIFFPMRPCDTAIHSFSCYWRHFLHLLQILPKYIRKVEIGLHVEARQEHVYMKHLRSAPWGEYGQALTSLTRLERVTFEDEELFYQNKCRPLNDRVKQYIRRKLRPLHKRGILYLD